jgi:hypothetical protein
VITSVCLVDSVIFQKSLSPLSKLLVLQLRAAIDTDSANAKSIKNKLLIYT